jgi:DNA-binding NtrC family response regulator
MFDCGAVASSLLEAELFGHEKNAFTGANAARAGLAEAANGGTLVIDEVGELPLDLQPKLLRLVERQEIRRVGATATMPIDVRIIACTHRSLRAETQAGRFREDLFFRLSALRLRLPALRERPDDIPGLVDALLSQRGSSLRFDQLSENDRGLLQSHRWPGNVRELRNIAERLIAFPNAAAGSLIDSESGAAPASSEAPGILEPLPVARQRAQDAFELQYVKQALARSGDSITEAAALAGVSRQFLLRLAKKHSLR